METIEKTNTYHEDPPSLEDFINNDYYLGTFLGDTLFPYWKTALQKVDSSGESLVLAGGSIGIGKSTFLLTGFCYDLCKALCLKDLYSTAGILRSSDIIYYIDSPFIFDQFVTWIQHSPFFKREVLGIEEEVVYFKNGSTLRTKVQGSTVNDIILGKALAGGIFEDDSITYDTITNACIRMKSRFDMATNKLNYQFGAL